MTDNIRCELYHAFDGHCCAGGETCPLKPDDLVVNEFGEPFIDQPGSSQDGPQPPKAIAVAADHAAAQRKMIGGMVAALTLSAMLLFALVATEADLAKRAKINQEQIAWGIDR